MSEILPFGSSCPKCGEVLTNPPSGLVCEYHREVTVEEWREERDLFKAVCNRPALASTPREEHLTWTCRCGHVFWTRTADYVVFGEEEGEERLNEAYKDVHEACEEFLRAVEYVRPSSSSLQRLLDKVTSALTKAGCRQDG